MVPSVSHDRRMGAKDWFICYADSDVREVLAGSPQLDRAATEELVRRLYPDRAVEPVADGTLAEDSNPDDDLVYAAVWPGAALVCVGEVALDAPSTLDPRFLEEGRGRTVLLHAMHSVVDWTAFAVWDTQGRLQRSLSVNADDEVIEDLGERLPFEAPFWAGEHPATEDEDDDDPLPFHPLELGEAALDHLFGFVFEGYGDVVQSAVDPFDVSLAGFRLGAEPRRRRGWFGRR